MKSFADWQRDYYHDLYGHNSPMSPAQNRSLKANWSIEAEQDLRSFHNINAEAELAAVIAAEINAEIDQEILRDLRNNSPKPLWTTHSFPG
jgi:hypothetical protein